MKPTLAISLGDPSGIGPEVVIRALATAREVGQVTVFGPGDVFALALELVGLPRPEGVELVDTGAAGQEALAPGRAAGAAQLAALDAATTAVLAGRCQALVTAPVAKHAVALVHPGFIGHTEHLAWRAGLRPDDVTMTFANDRLVVALVTTHAPLAEVPALVDARRLERTIRHLAAICRRLDPHGTPRLACAALNPHAGEGGLLGLEETRLLAPICRDLSRELDVAIAGPLPADSLFRDALRGEYAGVVALFHDQAMIPLKLHGVGQTVNLTWGLPFVRTSPDHGTAHDIAWRGAADPAGMDAALRLAARLAARG